MLNIWPGKSSAIIPANKVFAIISETHQQEARKGKGFIKGLAKCWLRWGDDGGW
jgi:hypothetical protein